MNFDSIYPAKLFYTLFKSILELKTSWSVRFLGGEDVKNPHEFPWMARLEILREINDTHGDFASCGASIITEYFF